MKAAGVTAEDERALLREKAIAARRLATDIDDAMAAKSFLNYAAQLEEQADRMEDEPVLPAAAAIPSGEPPIAHAAAALKPETPPAAEPSDDPVKPTEQP